MILGFCKQPFEDYWSKSDVSCGLKNGTLLQVQWLIGWVELIIIHRVLLESALMIIMKLISVMQ